MFVYSLYDTGKNQQKLDVFMRSFARIQQVDSVIGGQRPVVMLSGSVDALKRLLVQKTFQTMFSGNPFQRLHHKVVVVRRYVSLGINDGKFMLSRRYLVMFCFCCHAHFPELNIDVLHERSDSGLNDSEIMIIHLLPLRRHGSEQSAAGIDQIFSLQVFFLIDNEILLLCSDGRSHLFGGCIAEQFQQTERFPVDHFHGSKQRRLLIQSFSGIGTECCRNAKSGSTCILTDKGRRSAVPRRISPCLEGRAQSSGREGGSIRLSLNQLLSGEAHQGFPGRKRRSDKRIMLFGSESVQGLEPVGVVCGALLDRPLFHFMCDDICGIQIQIAALIDDFFQFCVNLLRQTLLHGFIIKYEFAEDVGRVYIGIIIVCHDFLLLVWKLFLSAAARAVTENDDCKKTAALMRLVRQSLYIREI